MLEQIQKLGEKWLDVNASNELHRHRGQFLATALGFIIIADVLLTVFNLVDGLLLNHTEELSYLGGDLAALGVFVLAFAANRKGYLIGTSLLIIFICEIYPFIFPFTPPESGLLLYMVPVTLAAFTLGPSSVLVVTTINIIAFQILGIGLRQYDSIPIPSIMVLVASGIVIGLIAERWERILLLAQEFRAKYQVLVDELPGLAYLREPGMNGRWLYCSSQIETILGIPPTTWAEHPEKWLWQIHPDDRERVAEEWSKCSDQGVPFHCEYRILMRDNAFIYVRDDATAILVPEQPLRYQGMILDITNRKQTEQDLRRDMDEMASLTRLSREITRVSDLDQVLVSIARLVTELLHSDAGGVYGLGDDGRLRILATWGIGERYVREVNAQGIAPDVGIIGRAVQERRPVAVADVYQDPNYSLAYFARMENIYGVLATPLMLGDQVRGVIVAWHRKPHEFTDRETHLLQTIAQQCVNAVENARLLQAEREQRTLAEALRDTASAFISTTSTEALFECILENLQSVMPYDAADIMLIDGNSVRVVCHRGYTELGKQGPVLTSGIEISRLIGPKHMVATREPIILADVSQNAEWLVTLETDWIGSYMGVPIRLKDSVIGFININSARAKAFSPRQLDPLQVFANQAAVAIENARLFSETQKRATEFAALYETSRDLATIQTMDLQGLLEGISQRAIQLLRADGGGMYLYDPAQQELEVRVGTHPSTPVGTHLKLGEGMAGRVAQTRQPLIVDDYRTWEFRSRQFPNTPLRAVLEVPMLYSGELIGVLVVEQLEENSRTFNNEDVQLLSLFASQAASAVHNAWLITETQQRAERLALLNRIARRVTESAEVNDILEMVYQELGSIVRADGICLALYDSSLQELEFCIRADRGIRENVIRRPATMGLSGLVASRRQPLLIRDYEKEKHSLPPGLVWGSGELPHSWLGVPMLTGDELIGIITVQTYDTSYFYTQADQELVSTIADTVALAVNKARLFQDQARRAEHLKILNDAALHIQQYLDPDKIIRTASDHVQHFGDFSHVFLLDNDNQLKHQHTSMNPHSLKKFITDFGDSPVSPIVPIELVHDEWERLQSGETFVVSNLIQRIISQIDEKFLPRVSWFSNYAPHSTALLAPVRVQNRTIGVFVLIGQELGTLDVPAFTLFVRQVSVALDNAHLFQQLRDHLRRQEGLYRISAQIAHLSSPQELCFAVTQALRDGLGFAYATIFLVDERTGDRVLCAYSGWQPRPGAERLRPDQGVGQKALHTGVIEYYPDVTREPTYFEGLVHARSEVDVPLRIGKRVAGILTVEDERVNAFTSQDLDVLQVVGNHLGVALEKAQLIQGLEQELAERKRAEEQAQRQVDRLAALHSIDTAISSSLDLNVTLQIILDQVTTQLHIDAADILRLNVPLQSLEYAAGRGFHSRGFQQTRLPLGKDFAGQAAYERRMVHIPNLSEAAGLLASDLRQSSETFVTYFAFPLVAKGEIKGVMELFHRTRLDPDQSWVDFAETLAAQTAIAMDNMALFDRLQKTNTDLIVAYDTTLEGWSRALELRDMETQGHALRVTELSLRLARALGVNDTELVNIRRGALLHDIGKMGIPDSILMKPGPLDEAEWTIMKKHPVYAYQLLSRVPYLRAALDIPYAHHEHWDGSGYPRGLRGSEIPLAARIFAVVDIWDALSYDRPYNKTWRETDIRHHLLSLSGKQLDAHVVEAFLKLDLRV